MNKQEHVTKPHATMTKDEYVNYVCERYQSILSIGYMDYDKVDLQRLASYAEVAYTERVVNNLPIYHVLMPQDARLMIDSWKIINGSPFSSSYYNAEGITWDYKPVGSLRISDHWHMITGDGKRHCKLTADDINLKNHWLMCVYGEDGYYHVVEDYGQIDTCLRLD